MNISTLLKAFPIRLLPVQTGNAAGKNFFVTGKAKLLSCIWVNNFLWVCHVLLHCGAILSDL